MPLDKCLYDTVNIQPCGFRVKRRNNAMPQHRRRDRTDILRRHMATLVQKRRALPAMSKAILARGPAPY